MPLLPSCFAAAAELLGKALWCYVQDLSGWWGPNAQEFATNASGNTQHNLLLPQMLMILIQLHPKEVSTSFRESLTCAEAGGAIKLREGLSDGPYAVDKINHKNSEPC
jgi:inorganic triphosphatase YgiF